MTIRRKIITGLYISGIGVSLFIGMQWISYYRLALTSRHTSPLHELLKPSGALGHALGIAGSLLMAMTLLYSVRKKYEFNERLGSLRAWLDFHMFVGVAGPILILWHSTFKFNGIIATTSFVVMVIVVFSGIVGRYLYGQANYRMNGLVVLNSWRFFHKKLSWLLLITALLHVTVTVILGFRWVF